MSCVCVVCAGMMRGQLGCRGDFPHITVPHRYFMHVPVCHHVSTIGLMGVGKKLALGNKVYIVGDVSRER